MAAQTKIAVLKERTAGETRVSAIPETVKKFIALGAVMAVEEGAGVNASITDEAFREAGAQVGPLETVLKDADIVFGVQGVEPSLLAGAKPGAWFAAVLDPFGQRARIDGYATAVVCAADDCGHLRGFGIKLACDVQPAQEHGRESVKTCLCVTELLVKKQACPF